MSTVHLQALIIPQKPLQNTQELTNALNKTYIHNHQYMEKECESFFYKYQNFFEQSAQKRINIAVKLKEKIKILKSKINTLKSRLKLNITTRGRIRNILTFVRNLFVSVK